MGADHGIFTWFHRQKWESSSAVRDESLGFHHPKCKDSPSIRLGMWLPSNKMKLYEASPWNNKTSAIQKKRFAKQNVATAKRQTCQNPAVNPLPACTETTRPNLCLRITSLFPQWYDMSSKLKKTWDLGFQNMLGQKGTAMKFNLESKMSNHGNQWSNWCCRAPISTV